ncbi:MAG: hypothetical protein EZS28_034755, partial [Streblomastix strix]
MGSNQDFPGSRQMHRNLFRIKFYTFTIIPFSDRNPYRPGTSIEDTSFLAIPKEGFADLKTSQPLNDLEKGCGFVEEAKRISYSPRLGYTAKAIKNVDIAPSMTYILKNYPTKEIYRVEGKQDDVSDIKEMTCDDNDLQY